MQAAGSGELFLAQQAMLVRAFRPPIEASLRVRRPSRVG
jgi:hypothetical protein